MKRIIILMILSIFVITFAHAQVWYVTGAGNDNNDGKTEKTAFRTLQKAADLVQPGDVVYIGNGIYTKNDISNNSAVLLIKRSGKPDAWITWKAIPGHKPEIHPTGWAGITVESSYHILDGLNVIGKNDSIALIPVSYTHLRAHETRHDLVCRLLLEKKKKKTEKKKNKIMT